MLDASRDLVESQVGCLEQVEEGETLTDEDETSSDQLIHEVNVVNGADFSRAKNAQPFRTR